MSITDDDLEAAPTIEWPSNPRDNQKVKLANGGVVIWSAAKGAWLPRADMAPAKPRKPAVRRVVSVELIETLRSDLVAVHEALAKKPTGCCAVVARATANSITAQLAQLGAAEPTDLASAD